MKDSYLQIGEAADLQVIYEDKTILAVNKPAGQLFHGYTKGLPETLVDQVKADLKHRYEKKAGVYLGVVHRLDRPVSGIVVFARQSKAAGNLGKQFQERKLQKIYLAWVEGIPQETGATLTDRLIFAEAEAEQEKECTLEYQRLLTSESHSLLAIRLGTGRRHQIRRQLAARGLPIVGDSEYGSKENIANTDALDPRFRPIALHALCLQFKHPQSYETLHLRAPLPFYWPEREMAEKNSAGQAEDLFPNKETVPRGHSQAE